MSRTRKRPVHVQKARIKTRPKKIQTKRRTKRSAVSSYGASSSSRLEMFFAWLSAIPSFLPTINLKKRKPLSLPRKIGIVLCVAGILFISIPKVLSLFSEPQIIGEEIPIKPDSSFEIVPSVQKTPTRIIVPTLKIDLPITRSRLINGYWEVSKNTASFGDGSAPPGTNGNTVIFAHAKEGMFLPLKNITYGKDVYILTSDTWFHYRVDEIREVNPTDVYVVKKTDDERLTLFTCDGFLDQKRLVVIAKPVK